MIALFLALTAAGADLELDLENRREAAIVVLTPFGMSEANSVSGIIDEAVETFTERTNLRLRPAAQAGVDEARLRECPADRRTDCWIERAREAPIVMVLIVTVAGTERGDEVAMLAVDLGSGQRAVVEPRALSPGLFAELVDGPLMSVLRRLDALRGFGTVTVQTDCTDCRLQLDDRSPIDVTAGRTTVRGLDEGRHDVVLLRGADRACTHGVSVTSSAEVSLDCLGLASDADGARVTTSIIGGSVAAIGVGLIVWSAVAATATTRVCVNADPSTCDFGSSARPGEATDGVVLYSPGSVPIAPLGVGLAAGGLSAIATAWLWNDAPWWAAAVVGLAGGAVVGTVGLLVD